ncbi:MAG: undecaprenyl-phosphate glucose phosphotransferase [Prevotellaceae bacterium]|jgi:putative colanic acid biosynthesis UDP-glucose lipid carrier transferase|nr:undecaprenyl-phosphate glucose phosphotransferase [Prevotellaceae bacterium]
MSNFKSTKLSFIQSVLNIGHITLVAMSYLLATLVFSKGKALFDSSQMCLLLLSFMVCTIHFYNNVENRSLLRFRDTLKNQVKIVVFSLAMWLVLLWLLHFKSLPYYTIVYIGVSSFILMMGWFWIVRTVVILYRKNGRNNLNVIIVGTNSMAVNLYKNSISYIPNGYNFKGFFTTKISMPDDLEKVENGKSLIKGTIDDVIPFLKKNRVEEIYFAIPTAEKSKAIMEYADNNMIRCNFLFDLNLPSTRTYGVRVCNGIPIVTLHDEPLLKVENRIQKRLFDIAFSALFLCTVFPFLYIILGSIIKLTSKGPVFFKQKRTGLDGKDFYCWKFRTMRPSEDADKKQASKGDNRITKIGAFMRKTNLDEMPQFINVLLGSMSIIGPRPHMLAHTTEYGERIQGYMLRHFVKPGISGWAQVNGFRGETERLEEMEGRVEHDIWYIENWSFSLDLKIVFMTVFNMLKGEEKAY